MQLLCLAATKKGVRGFMAVNTNQNPELWPGTVAFTQKKKSNG